MGEAALSKTMTDALVALVEAGSLERSPGGYWAPPGTPRHPHNGVPVVYWGTSTISALIDRGRAQYSACMKGRRFEFPIEVKPISAAERTKPDSQAQDVTEQEHQAVGDGR